MFLICMFDLFFSSFLILLQRTGILWLGLGLGNREHKLTCLIALKYCEVWEEEKKKKKKKKTYIGVLLYGVMIFRFISLTLININ